MENTNFLDGFYKQAGAMSKVKKYLSRNGASMGIGATIGALKGGMVGNETKGKDKKKNTAIGAAVGAVAGAGLGSVASGIQNRKKLKHTKNIRDLNNWSRRVRGYGKEKVIAKAVDLSKDKAKTFDTSFKKISFLTGFYHG